MNASQTVTKEMQKLYRDLEAAKLKWRNCDPCGYDYATLWHDVEMIAYEISDITGEHIDDLTL